MSAPSPVRAATEAPVNEVSPLRRIESHAWDPADWERSERTLLRAEADLALARGRLTYERFLRSGEDGSPAPGADGLAALPHVRQAVELYGRAGPSEGEREAWFWLGTLEQTLRQDYGAARAALGHARALALRADDRLLLSCVERHLGYVDLLEGHPGAAEQHLEESVRLRRGIGFAAGTAMALLALAEFAAENHDDPRAKGLLDEATAIARGCGAAQALQALESAQRRLAERAGGATRPSRSVGPD